jgi:hypothetical protein
LTNSAKPHSEDKNFNNSRSINSHAKAYCLTKT